MFEIIAKNKEGSEQIDTASTRQEAEDLKILYAKALGSTATIFSRPLNPKKKKRY